MNTRKVLLISLLFNLAWLSLLVGVFIVTQTAQANGPAAPSAAPAVSGPLYYSLTSIDFNSLDDANYSFSRSGFGMYRTGSTSPSFATAPVHLPAGAIINELYIDAEDNSTSGSVNVSLSACGIGRGACDDKGNVTSFDGGRKQTAVSINNYTVNNTNEALILFAKFEGGSIGEVALHFVRIGYTFPAAQYLPAILR